MTPLEQKYKAPFMVEDYFLDLRPRGTQVCHTQLEEFMEGHPKKVNQQLGARVNQERNKSTRKVRNANNSNS